MQEKSARHKAALQFAAAGIPVFPCLPNSKKPATEHGFHDATLDAAQIDAWWALSDYNLAFSPHAVGWGVVDLDGAEGLAAWAELAQQNGVPETYTVSTPSGGRHLYFEGELPPSASKIAPKIDTRGVGSYVLLPPSAVNGKSYAVISDTDIAPLPEWVRNTASRSAPRVAAATEDLDQPGNVARAAAYLRDLVSRDDVAVEGRGGNQRTYALACDILNLGLSPERAQELIEDIWNPHCLPPWDSSELATLIANADAYAQNEAGAWAVASASSTFAAALDKLPADMKAERRSRFYFENVEEQENAPDPTWLFPELVPDRATVLLLAKSGDFKSFITQHLALSTVSGKDFAGLIPVRGGPAFYGAHEGRNEIKKARRVAWQMMHGLERKDLQSFYVAPAPFVAIPEQVAEFKEQIRVRCKEEKRKPALIVLDTVAKCMMGLDENLVRDASIFVAFCDGLRDEFECSVIALHHLAKDGNPQGRGSGALVAGFDTVLHLKRVPETLAVELRVLQHKDAEERRAPWTFEGRKLGPSIAFSATSESEHKQIAGAHDIFERRKVGQALADLGAVGFERAVTTAVLATALVPPPESLSPEEALLLQNRTARSLSGLARTSLEAYATKAGRELLWHLPEAKTE